MQEFERTVTGKGQVTIPQAIRRMMGLQSHDKVSFEVEGDVVRIRRVSVSSKILEGFGAVKPRNKPENFQQIREEFEKGVADEVVLEP